MVVNTQIYKYFSKCVQFLNEFYNSELVGVGGERLRAGHRLGIDIPETVRDFDLQSR